MTSAILPTAPPPAYSTSGSTTMTGGVDEDAPRQQNNSTTLMTSEEEENRGVGVGEQRRRSSLSIPYTARLNASVEAGTLLKIQGMVHSDAQHIEFNLLNGVYPVPASCQSLHSVHTIAQVPFHICFHFDVGITVINTYENGDWGYEECHKNPLFCGCDFEISIRVYEEYYEVFANNTHLANFKHRVHYNTIDYIQAKGDITLTGIKEEKEKEATGSASSACGGSCSS